MWEVYISCVSHMVSMEREPITELQWGPVAESLVSGGLEGKAPPPPEAENSGSWMYFQSI